MEAIADSLVPFVWFLIPVFIAALALALLILFALQTSRTAKWFIYWSQSRDVQRPEGRFRILLRRQSRQRRGLRPETPAVPGATGEARSGEPLRARTRQRLEEKLSSGSAKSVSERLAELSAKPEEAPLAPSVPEEVLRRLEARRPPAESGSRPSGFQALQASRQMTELMLRSLEEQVRQGLLTPQTFEELKARLVVKQGVRPG